MPPGRFSFMDGATEAAVRALRCSKRPAARKISTACRSSRQEKAIKFFEKAKVDAKDLPVWVGELYLELHRGTYTSQAKNKRGKSEIRVPSRRCRSFWMRSLSRWRPHRAESCGAIRNAPVYDVTGLGVRRIPKLTAPRLIAPGSSSCSTSFTTSFRAHRFTGFIRIARAITKPSANLASPCATRRCPPSKPLSIPPPSKSPF